MIFMSVPYVQLTLRRSLTSVIVINADHTKELAVSEIELGVRHTSVMWDWMNNNDIPLPPPARWPPGVQPFVSRLLPGDKSNEPSASSTADHTTSGKKSPDKDNTVCDALIFHLSLFLIRS